MYTIYNSISIKIIKCFSKGQTAKSKSTEFRIQQKAHHKHCKEGSLIQIEKECGELDLHIKDPSAIDFKEPPHLAALQPAMQRTREHGPNLCCRKADSSIPGERRRT